MQKLPHIVIVGGGAGGIELAMLLGKKLGKRKQAVITLVDKSLTHLWKPLLHEVAAGTLDSHGDELNYLAHASLNHFQFQLGEMNGLDRSRREISLAPVRNDQGDEISPARTLQYDILVMAVGSTANDFGISGVKQHCFFLDSREQADQFQQHFLRSLMRAQNQAEPLAPGQLHVVIVGAGATGVELAAELRYTVKQAVNYGLDRLDPLHDVRLTIIEAGTRILSALPERMSSAVTQELHRLGVEVMTSERVVDVTEEGLTTSSGQFIPSQLKVWAAGIRAPEFLKKLDGLETNRLNQLLVCPTLQTTHDENIFALGDCACCMMPDEKNFVPPRAQAAHQQANFLASALVRKLQNKPLKKYHYRDYGSLISLSRDGSLGNLMGRITGNLMIQGKIARMVYLSLYKRHQITLHGWWRVMLLTIADRLTRRVKPRLKLH